MIERKTLPAAASPPVNLFPSTAPQNFGGLPLTTPSWMEIFLNLSCSRTLIFGEQSLPDSDFQCVNQKGISVAIVPEAGHSMSWENPSALARVLHEEFSEGSSQLKGVE